MKTNKGKAVELQKNKRIFFNSIMPFEVRKEEKSYFIPAEWKEAFSEYEIL